MNKQCVSAGDVELFPGMLKVVIDQQKVIMLTHKEMEVLRVLLKNVGLVVGRTQLLADIWNDDIGNTNITDVYIHRLRMKLEKDPDNPEYIISVRGSGYKFVRK